MTAIEKDSHSRVLLGNFQLTIARMAATVAFGIAATKLIYAELGEVNFGLFAVIGSSVFLVNALQTTLTASMQRYLAIEIGRKDFPQASRVLSTSVAITVVSSFFVAILGYISSSTIVDWLNVPQASTVAAVTTLKITIFSAAIMIMTSPFAATMTASQDFKFPAILATFFSAFSFIGALCLPYLPGNSLVNYSVIRLALVFMLSAATILVVILRFQLLRFSIWSIRRSLIAPVFSFGGWAGLGALGWQLRIQGLQLIGSTFFGPSFNASLGIAQQVSGYSGTLPSTLITVSTPTLTQLYGVKASVQMRKLRDLTSRFCPLLTMLAVTPFLIECDFLLEAWLRNPPTLARSFTTIILINLAIDQLSTAYGILFTATGAIRTYSLYSFSNVVVQLITSYFIATVFPSNQMAVMYVALLGTLANLVYRVGAADPNETSPYRNWFRNTVLRVGPIIATAAIVAYAVSLVSIPPIWRAFTVFAVHTIVLIGLSMRFSLSSQDRAWLAGLALSKWKRTSRINSRKSMDAQ